VEIVAIDVTEVRGMTSRGERVAPTALYVEVVTDEGPTGIFGPIQPSQADVIRRSLAGFLVGKDPLATEALHDQMLRLDRHGRSGLFMTGLSPVDCALWDLKGKVLGLPLWRLLGGPTRARVPAYASTLGHSVEPDAAAATAEKYAAMGYAAQKWFFAYGPEHGAAGMAANLDLAVAVREAVGSHYRLMFDVVMRWTAEYAITMARKLAQVEPAWLEEPVPPERVGSLRRIRDAAPVPIATGEHVYTRWQVKQLLEAGALDVVQTDPDWCGGITEQLKICALASSFDVPVVAHGHSLLAALHLAGALPASVVPEVEFLVLAQPGKQYFHAPYREPVDGELSLPVEAGLGLALDPSKVSDRRTWVP
jgi:L-alanine-DL-glutamate epimerase-like enolase superfamily enzyme